MQVVRTAVQGQRFQARGTALRLRKATVRTAPARALTMAAGGEEYDFDLFTIGAGSGGVRGSRFASSYGAKVAVCEMPFAAKASDTLGGVGGTCVIRGCVPKKLFVYGSNFATEFKDASGFGWSVPPAAHDWATLKTNKNKELERLTGAYKNILSNNNVELIMGRGSIVDAHTVDVDGKHYTAKNILIATGGRAFVPDIPGSELCLTSDDALELDECPKKICIVGSGYIALEFAGIFNSFGSEVHLFYRQPLPLRGFDEEVRQFVAEQLAESGIHLHPGETPEAVEKHGEGIKLKTSGGEFEADAAMFATGRKPNTKFLNLDAAGVELNESGAIKVDEYSKTTCDSVHAIGDVTDRINLTPVALHEGMCLASTLFQDKPTKPDHTGVACAVFSQPPVATVGLTEEEAIAEYGDVDVYTSNFRPMKNTISGSSQRMFMKLLVDVATDKVIGCHMVGVDGPEIMQGIAVALKAGATKEVFDSTIGIHPTAAEELVTMRSVARQHRK